MEDVVEDTFLMMERSNPILQQRLPIDSEPPMLTLKREEERLRNEIAVLEQLHGTNHPLSLNKIMELLCLLVDYDKYKAAEELGRQTFLAFRQYGNIRAASTMLTWLAGLYFHQGDWDKAEKVAIRAIDPGTSSGKEYNLRAKDLLSRIKIGSSRFQEAEEFLSQLLDIK